MPAEVGQHVSVVSEPRSRGAGRLTTSAVESSGMTPDAECHGARGEGS